MVDIVERVASSPQWRTPARIAALVLPLVTCAVLAGFRDSINAATAVLILVLWVVAAAASGDRVAGVLAALSSGAWFDFFLTEPFRRFTISDPDDIEATVLLILIGLGVTEIALWGHRQQARAARRSGYLEGVLSASRMVAEGDAPLSTLIAIVCDQIADVLGADTCRYIAGQIHDTRIAILDHNGVITRDGNTLDVERVGLPYNEYVALLVRRGPRVIGHFLVAATTAVAYPSLERRQVAVLLADQVAAAVDAE